MKRAFATVLMVAAVAVPSAFAQGPPGGGGYNPPEQIPQSAQCDSGAASGAFGAFGTYGSPHDWRGGADGGNTGDANSGVCNP